MNGNPTAYCVSMYPPYDKGGGIRTGDNAPHGGESGYYRVQVHNVYRVLCGGYRSIDTL